jgi:hypothetical protein
MAAAYALNGHKDQAMALTRRIEERASQTGYVRYHLAILKSFLGDPDGVFHWLEQSAEAREQQILYIRVDPTLAAYQSDPRMIALERRVGLIP